MVQSWDRAHGRRKKACHGLWAPTVRWASSGRCARRVARQPRRRVAQSGGPRAVRGSGRPRRCWPWSSTSSWEKAGMISSTWWVTSTMAGPVPESASFCSVARNDSRDAGSSPAHGSSRIISMGRAMQARANSTFWRSPCDSTWKARCAKRGDPQSLHVCQRVAIVGRRRVFAAQTFQADSRQTGRTRPCRSPVRRAGICASSVEVTQPMLRRSCRRSVRARPPRSTCPPALGHRYPQAICRSVVLPAPLRPSSTQCSSA